jgi:hypothetical protein
VTDGVALPVAVIGNSRMEAPDATNMVCGGVAVGAGVGIGVVGVTGVELEPLPPQPLVATIAVAQRARKRVRFDMVLLR